MKYSFENDNLIVEEAPFEVVDETAKDTIEELEIVEPVEKKTFKNNKKVNKEQKKIATCKVLHYNKCTKALDLDLNGYGIRVNDVEVNGDTVEVEYMGEVGKPNFIICTVR